MKSDAEIREVVRERYAEAAERATKGKAGCCDPSPRKRCVPPSAAAT